MALTVEDGTGLANADAFIALAAWKTYATAHGYDYQDPPNRESQAFDDTTEIEPAIRKATSWLCTAFTWKGTRVNGRSQALAWPRTDVEDAEGEDVDSDALPAEIVAACAEAVWYELNNPGGLNPSIVLIDRVKRERIGPIETEYATASTAPDAARPVLTLVNDLVAGLTTSNDNPLVGMALRA